MKIELWKDFALQKRRSGINESQLKIRTAPLKATHGQEIPGAPTIASSHGFPTAPNFEFDCWHAIAKRPGSKMYPELDFVLVDAYNRKAREAVLFRAIS
jgi:hypothetical protein